MRLIVTGADGALGGAVAAAARENGWSVASIGRGPDLSDETQSRAAIETAADGLGGLDGLAHIAGGYSMGTLAAAGPELFDTLYRKNLRSTACVCRAALSRLCDGGAIVNVAAAGAVEAGEGMGAYAASKAGVMRLTEALAGELAPRRIRVNSILPTLLDTPANRVAMPKADTSRWVRLEDAASAVLFLLSDRAASVTGTHLKLGR